MNASPGLLPGERPRARGRRHPGRVDVVLEQHRDPEQREMRAALARLVGGAGVGERRRADGDHGVEQRVELLDPMQVELGELHRLQPMAVHQRLELRDRRRVDVDPGHPRCRDVVGRWLLRQGRGREDPGACEHQGEACAQDEGTPNRAAHGHVTSTGLGGAGAGSATGGYIPCNPARQPPPDGRQPQAGRPARRQGREPGDPGGGREGGGGGEGRPAETKGAGHTPPGRPYRQACMMRRSLKEAGVVHDVIRALARHRRAVGTTVPRLRDRVQLDRHRRARGRSRVLEPERDPAALPMGHVVRDADAADLRPGRPARGPALAGRAMGHLARRHQGQRDRPLGRDPVGWRRADRPQPRARAVCLRADLVQPSRRSGRVHHRLG